MVNADRQRLSQILLNLVSNAIKYNREGGSIRSTARPSNDMVRVDIADTGFGLSSTDLERIFVPFDRLGAERSDIEGVRCRARPEQGADRSHGRPARPGQYAGQGNDLHRPPPERRRDGPEGGTGGGEPTRRPTVASPLSTSPATPASSASTTTWPTSRSSSVCSTIGWRRRCTWPPRASSAPTWPSSTGRP